MATNSAGGSDHSGTTRLADRGIVTTQQIEKYIQQGKKNFSDNNHGIICPWNNYSIVEHSGQKPMTLSVLQDELNGGADFYFLVLHGTQYGSHPLVGPELEKDRHGWVGRFYTLGDFTSNPPKDPGQIRFQCCHSEKVDLKEAQRPVFVPFLTNQTVMGGVFLGQIANAVEMMCCAAMENDR